MAECFVPAKDCVETAAWIRAVHLWQGVEDPYLYTVIARIIRHNEVLVEVEADLGVREYYVDPRRDFS